MLVPRYFSHHRGSLRGFVRAQCSFCIVGFSVALRFKSVVSELRVFNLPGNWARTVLIAMQGACDIPRE